MVKVWEWPAFEDVWREIPPEGGFSTSDWVRVTVWVWLWADEPVNVPPVLVGGVVDVEPLQLGQKVRAVPAAIPVMENLRNSLRVIEVSFSSAWRLAIFVPLYVERGKRPDWTGIGLLPAP